MKPLEWLERRRLAWIVDRHPRRAQIKTGTRSIYILPSRSGIAMMCFLMFIFLLAVNFQNALVFGLFFWLLSLAILNLHYTHHNIAGLMIRCVSTRNAVAGGSVEFVIELKRSNARARHAIELSLEGGALTRRIDIAESLSQRVTLALPVQRRGFVVIPRITLRSVYPFGTARTWSYARLTAHAVVYPDPVDAGIAAHVTSEVEQDGESLSIPGVSDFESLRAYVPGDKISRVHWPASSRGVELQVKHFIDSVARDEWIRWDNYMVLPTEQRLQHMAFLVIATEMAGTLYGLELPDRQFEPANGDAHKKRCLVALGSHGLREPDYA